jgi:hypothetical protein
MPPTLPRVAERNYTRPSRICAEIALMRGRVAGSVASANVNCGWVGWRQSGPPRDRVEFRAIWIL